MKLWSRVWCLVFFYSQCTCLMAAGLLCNLRKVMVHTAGIIYAWSIVVSSVILCLTIPHKKVKCYHKNYRTQILAFVLCGEMLYCMLGVDAITQIFQKQNFSSLTLNTFGK